MESLRKRAQNDRCHGCLQRLPCHLYFDLEFSKKENARKNGDEMVDILLSVVFDALLEKYGIEGNHDCIVELDSSTEGMLFGACVYTLIAVY